MEQPCTLTAKSLQPTLSKGRTQGREIRNKTLSQGTKRKANWSTRSLGMAQAPLETSLSRGQRCSVGCYLGSCSGHHPLILLEAERLSRFWSRIYHPGNGRYELLLEGHPQWEALERKDHPLTVVNFSAILLLSLELQTTVIICYKQCWYEFFYLFVILIFKTEFSM